MSSPDASACPPASCPRWSSRRGSGGGDRVVIPNLNHVDEISQVVSHGIALAADPDLLPLPSPQKARLLPFPQPPPSLLLPSPLSPTPPLTLSLSPSLTPLLLLPFFPLTLPPLLLSNNVTPAVFSRASTRPLPNDLTLFFVFIFSRQTNHPRSQLPSSIESWHQTAMQANTLAFQVRLHPLPAPQMQ